MNIIREIHNSKELKHFWEKTIGKSNLSIFLENTEAFHFELFEQNHPMNTEMKEFEELLKGCKLDEGEELFHPFFRGLAGYAKDKLNYVLKDSVDTSIICSLAQTITERLTVLYMRCLIFEMHQLKHEGSLSGEDSQKEYEYYLENYLKDCNFLKTIFQKYPIIPELYIQKIKDSVDYVLELLEHLNKDKNDIVIHLCEGHSFQNINDIKIGLSDEHSPGKTVAKLALDNGYTIYHKPHDLTSIESYNRIHRWLLQKCGMDCFKYKIINRHTYGWEAEVKNEECSQLKEIEQYYRRMGIQLCLAYTLNISDLHMENIIAHKEYPVIIDMELFPDRHWYTADRPESLKDLLKDSVFNTGMLPGNSWSGESANVGGFGEAKEQRAPFKMPMVANERTSDMCIYYDYPKLKPSDSLPGIRGERIDYRGYIGSILQGFEEAYQSILKNKKDFMQIIENCPEHKSRYLFRNTQEYLMYQNSSNFPQFMERQDCRYLMLFRMNNGLSCDEKYREQILKYEMICTYQFIFPIFYAYGNSLYLGNGVELDGYFPGDTQSLVSMKINKLSLKDLQLQKKIIETAFLPSIKSEALLGRSTIKSDDDSTLTPRSVADMLINDMQICGDDFGWMGIQYNRYRKTYLAPVDMYLYNGICGIVLFMAAMEKNYPDQRYSKLSRQLINRLFEYTDKILELDIETQEYSYGLFTGEASFIYTYWLLYKMTGNEKFLEYAGKHSEIVMKHLDEVKSPDLLDGKSGIAIALLYMYEQLKDQKYLDAAEYLINLLIDSAVFMPAGIGWINEGQKEPLAGLAHGNSGMALAITRLWKYTKKSKYLDVLEKVIHYEDSLYDDQLGNWLDMRNDHSENPVKHDTVAWCHGAAGILVSRFNIYKDTGMIYGNTILDKAVRKVWECEKQDACLCHGTAGILEMLGYIEEMPGILRRDESGMTSDPLKDNDLSLEDRNNPGFMTGLSGIGYSLLRNIDSSLPDIICFS